MESWASLVGQPVKNLPAIQDTGSIPGSGRSPGEGNDNPLHYPCLENPMDREAWWATVHGVSRVGHNVVTESPPPPCIILKNCTVLSCSIVSNSLQTHGL